jgi:hypothetical protein
MSLRGEWAPALPELDRFLFASVGEEVDGMPLSVLSALARLNLDPRGEAARLSRVAGEAAADQLARTLARLPGGRWTASEMQRIAAGLVELLPLATKGGKDDADTSSADRKISARALRFLVYVALTGALLGLLAFGTPLFDGHRQTTQPGSQADSPASRH